MVLVNEGKMWSTKVIKKLNKRAEKSRPHKVDPYGSDWGGGTMKLFTTVKYYLMVISRILNTLSTLKKT
jgi:hypothetical protein